jgi:hypothetical protein
LIPFPLSIIFVIVFAVVVEFVFWKLRRNGKIYKILSNLTLVIGAFVVILLILSILAAMN